MRRLPLLLLLPLLLPQAPALAQTPPRDTRILVVHNRSEEPYQQALRGIREGLAGRAEIDDLVIGGSAAAARLAAAGRPLTLALGGASALAMHGHAAPLVSCMVLNSSVVPAAPDQYGVVLEHPLRLQFDWIRRVLPRAQRVGVLYNPAENQARIDAAALAARGARLELVARPVLTPEDIPDALARLANRVDVLWGLNDALALNAQTARRILLFSYQNRIPLIGPSDAWVAAGALFALGWDFQDIGRQCADTALQVLAGTPPKPAYAAPRKPAYYLNRRAAEQLNIELPESLFKGAARVHD